MASAQETLHILQETANRGMQDQLSDRQRAMFDEAVNRGMVIMPGQQMEDQPLTGETVQDVQFSPAELELWKRDNLSPVRRAKMEDRRALNLMRVDFLESGVDKDSFLLGEKAPSGMEQAGVGLAQGARSVAQEIGKLGLAAGDVAGIVEPETRQQFAEDVSQQRREFAESDIGQMGITKGFQTVGEVLPTMVVPGGVVGGIMRRLAAGAAGGAVGGAVMPTESADVASDQRLQNILLSSAGGGIFGGATAVGSKAVDLGGDLISNYTKKGGREAIVEPLSKLISRADTNAQDEAAKGIGVFLSPAERTKLPLIVDLEKTISLPKDTALNFQLKLQDREKTLSKSVKQLIQDIAPKSPTRAASIKEGYELIARTEMPAELLSKIEGDLLLGPQYKRFLKDPYFKPSLSKLPKNSLARVDEFQKFLRDRAKALESKSATGSRNIRKAREDLITVLDTALPPYAVARRESQLNIIRESIEKKTAGIKGAIVEDGVRTPSAVQFYQKFLKSDKDFENLIRNLDDNSPAAIKATQLRIVLGAVEGTPLDKVFSSTEPFRSTGTFGLGKEGIALSNIARSQRKQFSEGMLDYITDPNLSSELLDEAVQLAEQSGKIPAVDLDRLAGITAKALSRSIAAGQNEEDQ